MIDTFINKLKADSGIAGLGVSSDDVYPLARLQDTDEPAIVVQLVGSTGVHTHDKGTDTFEHSVEVTSFHSSAYNCWKLASRCRVVLDGLSDAPIFDIKFETQATDVFLRKDSYSVTQRYSCMEIA